ncbi:MAG: RecX family transcriptional regulator [Sphingomonas sp.]|nr:MAG: RecX family transcriptional regulator [Sphingomonas sp.]
MDAARLEALALRYVGRYATTRAKLRDYLLRKLDGAEWAGADPPDPAALVSRMAELGYVDDRLFAGQRAAALGRRGYGARRIGMALRAAGIEGEDGEDALEVAREGALAAALALARRRRIGPFADEMPDRPAREKAIAMLVRAGHDPVLARQIASSPPGQIPGD